MIFNENAGPFPWAYGMKHISNLMPKKSNEIRSSAISVGFETLDRELFNPDACYQPLAECGVKWARCQTGWSRCEKEKGRYDFAWLDAVADNLLARGIEPWFSLCYGNILYCPDAPHASCVGSVPMYYGDEALTAWKNFVEAVVTRYHKRVRHWEIWNEPNGEWCWGNVKPNGADYARFARLTAEVVHRVDPQARIIGGSVCGFDFNFIEEALLAGLGDCCYALSFHAYHLVPEWGYASAIAFLRSLLSRHAPNVKLWQGETGCPSVMTGHHDEWLGIRNINEEIQAKWVTRRLLTDLRHGVELSSYFHSADLMERPYVMGDGKETRPVMLGLLNGLSYTPKKAYFALRSLCAIFDQDTIKEDLFIRLANTVCGDPTWTSDRDKYLTAIADSYTRKGYPLYVYYRPIDMQNESPVESSHSVHLWNEAEKKMDEPVLVDPVSGKIYSTTVMELKRNLTVIRNVPLMDYPLIITDAKAL